MLTYFSVEGYRNFATKLTWDFANIRDYRFNTDALIKYGDTSLVKCALVYGRKRLERPTSAMPYSILGQTLG